MRVRTCLLTGAALIASGLSTAAQAGNITFFQFSADPDYLANPKELVYSPTAGLTAGPGAAGEGSIFSPGLLGTITGGLPGIPADPLTGPIGYGASPFYVVADLSLSLANFLPAGPAIPGATSISQPLTGGSFAISYHSASGDVLLLSGTTTSALITEKSTGSNASILSGAVTYTGGLLFDELEDAGLDSTGTFSFALTGLRGTYGTTPINGQQRLAGFDADATASFDAAPLTSGGSPVPTPAAIWGGFGLLGMLGATRFKKRQAHRD